MPEAEVLPVLRPLRGDGQRRRDAADLAVGVDRVAEVDVEVVALGRHPPVDLEDVVGRLARLRVARAVGVAGDREADRLRVGRPRRRPELAGADDLRLAERRREGVDVAAVREQPVDAALDDEVVLRRSPRGRSGRPASPLRGELQTCRRTGPGLVRARPEQGARRRDLAGGDAVRRSRAPRRRRARAGARRAWRGRRRIGGSLQSRWRESNPRN